MKHSPVHLEDHFSPGFLTKPAVLVGSQTSHFIRGNPEEQAWEGFYLAAARPLDVVIVRNIDPLYIDYWTELMGLHTIINIQGSDEGEYLSQILLGDQVIQDKIKKEMHPDSKLMVFFPTPLEEKLSETLGIPLHGSDKVSSLYGVKSGIRELAKKAGVPMSPGFTCKTVTEVEEAIHTLQKNFDTVILKHDLSFSGYYSKKIERNEFGNIEKHLHEVCDGEFKEGRDTVVIEGWLKSKASLCMHIEIEPGKEPVLSAGWEQLIDSDGVSYVGAGPLRISEKALESFKLQSKKLAFELKKEGAIGSFGPDFLIAADTEERVEPDTAILLELNARVPYTAVPLQIIKDVKGIVGSGFYAKHVHLPKDTQVKEVLGKLKEDGLLITKKSKNATGIVPYNTGLLPWGIFDAVAMADTFDEAESIMKKVDTLFSGK